MELIDELFRGAKHFPEVDPTPEARQPTHLDVNYLTRTEQSFMRRAYHAMQGKIMLESKGGKLRPVASYADVIRALIQRLDAMTANGTAKQPVNTTKRRSDR